MRAEEVVRLPHRLPGVEADAHADRGLIAGVARVEGALHRLRAAHGVACGAVRFVVSEAKALRGEDVSSQRDHLRGLLGYYLLLGLEFLIAADIVESIVSPSREELINLAIVVAVRTVISFSLNWELAQHAKRRG